MSRLLFVLFFLPTLAIAQSDPTPTFTFDLQAPTGPVRYALTEIASVRFLGEEVPGPTLKAGDRVEWLTEKDGWVRFKTDSAYGWAPAAQLSESPPADDP